jgi:hypothetical protein
MSFVRPPDDYERQYMPTGDDVVFRDKAVAPRWLLGLVLVAVLGVAVALPLGHLPWWTALAVLGVGGAGMIGNLMLWIIRTTLTREKLVVHYGFLRDEIDLASIEDCSAVDLPLTRRWRVGWGIGIRGSYYTVGTQRAVKLRYRTESGRIRTLWLSSEDPEALAQAVNEARSPKVRLEASPPRSRVEAETGEEDQVDEPSSEARVRKD